MVATQVVLLDSQLQAGQSVQESNMVAVVEALESGTYYKPGEKPEVGWTGAVDGSGLKPTIQTSRHECCW